MSLKAQAPPSVQQIYQEDNTNLIIIQTSYKSHIVRRTVPLKLIFIHSKDYKQLIKYYIGSMRSGIVPHVRILATTLGNGRNQIHHSSNYSRMVCK